MSLWDKYKWDVVADFHEYYSIRAEEEFDNDAIRFCELLLRLPKKARTFVNLDQNLQLDDEYYLLRSIEYNMRLQTWFNTKDAQSSRPKNMPEPIYSPWEIEEQKEKKRQERRLVKERYLTAEETDLTKLFDRSDLVPLENIVIKDDISDKI